MKHCVSCSQPHNDEARPEVLQFVQLPMQERLRLLNPLFQSRFVAVQEGIDLLRLLHGGVFIFGFFSFLDFCLFFVASGFCGFWLLWLLASVASGFCGFWHSWLLWLLAFVAFGFLAYPSICLYLSIYLSIFLSFFLSFGSCSPFSFCICFSCCFRCRDETKQGSKQASKKASKHELLTFGSGVLLGGALRPPQPPPRHEICTSSPTPSPATKSIF